MRRTTKQILLLLYTLPDRAARKISITTLRELLPGLTSGGFRSLIHVLQHKEMLHVHKDGTANIVMGTPTGDRAIEAVFPWLRDVSMPRQIEAAESTQGSLILFRTPSRTDPQFRRLRRMILTEGAHLLSRGCYIFPSRIPTGLWIELTEHYKSNVAVIGVDRWLMGNQQAFYNNTLQVSDVFSALSGVSKEMTRLIMPELAWRELNHQQKTAFLSLLWQAIDIFGDISGQTDSTSELISVCFAVLDTCQQAVSNT